MAKVHRRGPDASRLEMLLLLVAASLGLMMAQGVQAADDCVPPPISLPIVNVTIPNGNSRRGVALNIGQPPKQYSFLPDWNVNNTFLYGPNCPLEDFVLTETVCETFRGGIYTPDNSSSFSKINSSYVPVTDADFPSDTYSLFTEKLTFDHFSLPHVVMARPLNPASWGTQGYNPQHLIGMGAGSTFMSALLAARGIASNSFGYYWGADGTDERDQFAGSFVLGGYDRAKTIGNGDVQPLLSPTEACPTGMLVTIVDMVLNFRDGNDTSIFHRSSEGAALQACIVPEIPVLMELPYSPYFFNLEESINNTEIARDLGIDWWNVILDSKKPIYDGDLTFKFGSGLEITIPNRQLIVPERYIDPQGHIANNNSQTVIRLNSLESTSALALPVLGRYFFGSAYVQSNPDAGQFTLWQLNPITDVDLVAVDPSNAIVPSSSLCGTATASATTSTRTSATQSPHHSNDANTTSASSSRSSSSSSSSGLSHGAIGGVVVGAAAGVFAAAGLAFWLLRRRRRSNANATANAHSHSHSHSHSHADAVADDATTIQPSELGDFKQESDFSGSCLTSPQTAHTTPSMRPSELHDSKNLPCAAETAELEA